MKSKYFLFLNGVRKHLIPVSRIAQIYPSILDAEVSYITLVNGERYRAEQVEEVIVDTSGLSAEAVDVGMLNVHIR